MAECVKIYVEVPVDSELYKKAVELSDSNKDLGLDMFSSPENVLQICLELGSNPHILGNMFILSRQANSYREKRRKEVRKMSEVKIPEIEGRTPDKVVYSESGRRIEMYGKPSAEACAEALFRIIKKIEETKNDV